MQIYECLSACAVIAAATGALSGLCSRLHVRPFEIGFAGALVLAMSRFPFVPVAEFRCNPAALCLPAYFLILSASGRKAGRGGGARARRGLFIAASLPVICSLAASLTELIRMGYASVDLSNNALCNAQALLCAALFLSSSLRAALRERKRRLA